MVSKDGWSACEEVMMFISLTCSTVFFIPSQLIFLFLPAHITVQRTSLSVTHKHTLPHSTHIHSHNGGLELKFWALWKAENPLRTWNALFPQSDFFVLKLSWLSTVLKNRGEGASANWMALASEMSMKKSDILEPRAGGSGPLITSSFHAY